MATKSETRQQGRVKKWLAGRGYGFIARKGERDIFVHVSALKGPAARRLADGGQLEGVEVTFVVAETARGLQAEDVRTLEEYQEREEWRREAVAKAAERPLDPKVAASRAYHLRGKGPRRESPPTDPRLLEAFGRYSNGQELPDPTELPCWASLEEIAQHSTALVVEYKVKLTGVMRGTSPFVFVVVGKLDDGTEWVAKRPSRRDCGPKFKAVITLISYQGGAASELDLRHKGHYEAVTRAFSTGERLVLPLAELFPDRQPVPGWPRMAS